MILYKPCYTCHRLISDNMGQWSACTAKNMPKWLPTMFSCLECTDRCLCLQDCAARPCISHTDLYTCTHQHGTSEQKKHKGVWSWQMTQTRVFLTEMIEKKNTCQWKLHCCGPQVWCQWNDHLFHLQSAQKWFIYPWFTYNSAVFNQSP